MEKRQLFIVSMDPFYSFEKIDLKFTLRSLSLPRPRPTGSERITSGYMKAGH